ncbi:MULTISPECIES: DUF6634 family protein [unclassified Bradyrhizobium]|uniref:DUF6634 family protein n=1 Tax=unclassified Bradyrhizobium TaxID=2631580 RepID=UPI0024E0F958|nr:MULTISPECIES: DUF6634 family protein [unclassified Bradyrhizobium]
MILDFESYLAGDQPHEFDLAAAPVLDNWEAVVSVGLDGTRSIVICGDVAGHPHKRDGERVTTSPVVWIDRNNGWCRTRNRLYRLDGQMIPIDGSGF